MEESPRSFQGLILHSTFSLRTRDFRLCATWDYWKEEDFVKGTLGGGSLGGSAVWRLPSAQGVILESRDRILHQAPCTGPASPSACVSASLSLSLMNK